MELFLEPYFGQIQLWSDVIGCICGALVTVFLIWTIFRATDDKFRSYSHLILISAVFDLFLAVIQLCTQHQIVFIDKILFVMPQSFVERKVFEHFGSVMVFFHVFTTFYGLLILTVQFHHRYLLLKKLIYVSVCNGDDERYKPCNFWYVRDLLSSPVRINKYLFPINSHGRASLKKLIRNVCITVCIGLSIAFMAYLATLKGASRGRDHYLRQLPKTPNYQRVADQFLYVNDAADWETVIFFNGLFYLNLLSYFVVLFYAFKSWRLVHATENLSKKARSQQRQCSMCLLMMTFNTTVFAFIPMSLPSISHLICDNSFASGFLTMILFSWLPFANSMSTFLIITNYRRYALSFFGLDFLSCKPTKVDRKRSNLVQTSSLDTITKRRSAQLY